MPRFQFQIEIISREDTVFLLQRLVVKVDPGFYPFIRVQSHIQLLPVIPMSFVVVIGKV
jgi:hypothetical protein